MEEERRQTRMLIVIALVFCALLAGYNAFYVPDAPLRSFIETDITSDLDGPESEQSPEKLDLNTATLEELDALDGIGPVIAQKIVDYREEYGGFSRLEELKEVQGIGDALLEKLRNQVTVGYSPYGETLPAN